MDIERLSKSQIVLLTLLVSFVTSIATGIVTVSLMDQAPPSVAQTVNRVIERTVQQVVPSSQPAAASTPQTVVVKESDLLAQAVAMVTPSVVRIYTDQTESGVFLGLGVVIGAQGTIATDAGALAGTSAVYVKLPDGKFIHAAVSSKNPLTDVTYLEAATSTTEGTVPAWKPAQIASSHPALGASVVALEGKASASVAQGIVTSFGFSGASSPELIATDVTGAGILPGTPLIDRNGDLVGISTSASRAESDTSFIDMAAAAQAATATSTATSTK